LTPADTTASLPPAAADVVAEAVEGLTSRLRKKLDAAIELYAAVPATRTTGDDGDSVGIACGEDAVVTLRPGPSGAVTHADQAECTCLLAPRCLHRAAVLSACPVADPDLAPVIAAPATARADVAELALPTEDVAALSITEPSITEPAVTAPTVTAPTVTGPTSAQVAAATGLWSAAAAALAAGIPGAGAISQAELLRAAHTARLAGLHRAEAAALRVVRGLREARARQDGHRLADLAAALCDLLLTSALLAAADPDPALIGTARRSYQPGGALRVHGVCREPVISAAGYAGVVTHLLADDGRWYSAADVKPGGPGRARAAATAPVALGPAALDHAQLSRGGLLITGATVSPEGRLGSGKGVRATPIAGLPWTAGPVAALLGRPLAEAAASHLSVPPGSDQAEHEKSRELVACDVAIIGALGNHVLAHELTAAAAEADSPERATAEPSPTVIHLTPADAHPDLAHTTNLRQLASRPGLRVRVVGRLDPDRAATLRPLAVGPVPDCEATLRLPEEWLGRADLGYDRIQGSHLPPLTDCPPPAVARTPPDPLADSPLWRYRRLVELAVAGGRRAVGEFARAEMPGTRARRATVSAARNGSGSGSENPPSPGFAPLRVAGFHAAADLAGRLALEADRRDRDDFGRLTDPDPERYARTWLAAAAHLAAVERALVLASWRPASEPELKPEPEPEPAVLTD
jgi:hypothetical protein